MYAAHGSEITAKTRTYIVSNIRHDEGLGYFADVLAKRDSKTHGLGMQCGEVIGHPGAEAWEVMGLSGAGRSIIRFAVHQGEIHALC